MQRAIDETNRRRKTQQEYNETHGIVPKGITKSVTDILEGAMSSGANRRGQGRKVADARGSYTKDATAGSLSAAQLAKQIGALEQQMYEHARNLEFEDAALLRDRLQDLKQQHLIGAA